MPRPVLLAVVLLTLPGAGWAQRPRAAAEPTACSTENATCRDDCTMEFGASVRKRAKLGRCLEQCQAKHARCTERWFELQRADITPPGPPPPSRPAATATVDMDPAPQAAPSTRTRSSEPEEAAPAAELPAAEGEPYNDGITIPSDEQLRGPAKSAEPEGERKPGQEKKKPAHSTVPATSTPAVAPKPAPSRPEIPPEPEYDISDWDPDAEE